MYVKHTRINKNNDLLRGEIFRLLTKQGEKELKLPNRGVFNILIFFF